MADVNALLNERLKKGDQSSKMSLMSKQTASGHLTSFAGVFNMTELSDREKAALEALLNEYASDQSKDLSSDLRTLTAITAEVKAISNQAAILHGERIKRVRTLLMNYRDGAFSAWLVATYGNRQTPYNFLQYFEFCEALPKALRVQLDQMPRQAIYTLASRDVPLAKKQEMVATYNGETKTELLRQIRERFPLDVQDRRREDVGESTLQGLKRLSDGLRSPRVKLSKAQKKAIFQLLDTLYSLVDLK